MTILTFLLQIATFVVVLLIWLDLRQLAKKMDGLKNTVIRRTSAGVGKIKVRNGSSAGPTSETTRRRHG